MRRTRVRPAPPSVGYDLVTPGKNPRIEYIVMTDWDLMDIAADYFEKAELTAPK